MMLLGSEWSGYRIPVAVVTGTHSSGKTTVIDEYARHSVPVQADPDFGLRVVKQTVGDTILSVVVVPEAARQYCSLTKNPRAMLAPSIYPQLDVERLGESMINYATMVACKQAQTIAGYHVAALLLDRSPLDALSYGALIAPHQSHRAVTLRDWLRNSATMFGSPSESAVIDIQTRLEQDAKQIDRVFFTNEAEVTFETDGQRIEAADFRTAIAHDLRKRYEVVVGKNAITDLNGNEETRVTLLRQEVVNMLLTATAI